MGIRVKAAQDLVIGDEILIDGCDVVVDGITLVAPEVEIKYHTRFLPGAYPQRTRLPRYHSLRLIDGE